jgi:predicted nucleotidyltransferase
MTYTLAAVTRRWRLRLDVGSSAPVPGAPRMEVTLGRREDRLDLLDAVVYGDSFDCAVTFDELWRYARIPIDRETLRLRLRDPASLRPLLVERDGLYCLNDRPELVERRRERVLRARTLERRARRVARVLRHAPFVRGLALTGSVAADDAQGDADVDLLVVVAPNRVGTVFVVLGSVSRLLQRRLLCPNYYVSATSLGLAPAGLYVARELSQARSLAGDAGALLRGANPWLADVFPNAAAPEAANGSEPEPSRLQKVFEAVLGGRAGDRLERWARTVTQRRLRAHYGGDVPRDVAESFAAGVSLRFHGLRAVDDALERYSRRRAELAERIVELDRARRAVVARTA